MKQSVARVLATNSHSASNFRVHARALHTTLVSRDKAFRFGREKQHLDPKSRVAVGEENGLQDLLLQGLKGVSMYLYRARAMGERDQDSEHWVTSLFYTLTNVNDEARLFELLNTTEDYLERAKSLYEKAAEAKGAFPEVLSGAANFKLDSKEDVNLLIEQAKNVRILTQKAKDGDDVVAGLQELIMHGLKGMGAHTDHVGIRDEVSLFLIEALDFLTKTNHISVEDLLELALKVGEINLRVLKMIDREHDSETRNSLPTTVPPDSNLASDDFSRNISSEAAVLAGYGRSALLNVAPQIIKGVNSGSVKHIFLIGGGDTKRNYLADVAKEIPRDSVILSMAGLNSMNLSEIGEVPQILDVAQFAESFSAIEVATALANTFNTDVNSLPLSVVISWFDQKVVAVLFTLLHLGVKKIYLGPGLPAFVTPNMLEILIKTYDLKTIGNTMKDEKTTLREQHQQQHQHHQQQDQQDQLDQLDQKQKKRNQQQNML